MTWCYIQDDIKDYISDNLELPDSSIETTAVGFKRKEYEAAALYFNYEEQHGSLEMSFVSTNPRNCTKRIINGFMAYPFIQLGCVRVNAYVRESNKACLRLLGFIGFKQEGIQRLAYEKKEDVILCGLLASDYKYFPKENIEYNFLSNFYANEKTLKNTDNVLLSINKRSRINGSIPVLSTDRKDAKTKSSKVIKYS